MSTLSEFLLAVLGVINTVYHSISRRIQYHGWSTPGVVMSLSHFIT